MKRSMMGVAVGLALAATTASAQSIVPVHKPVSFGISGGLSMPTGDFGEGFKSGYNVSGLLQFQGPMWPVAIRVEGQFQNFSGKEIIDGASTQTIGGLANVLYQIPTHSIVKPYVTGGLGFFHLKSDLGDACPAGASEDECSGSTNKFGYDFGAGLEFQLTGMSTFIEANWQSVRAEGTALNQIPIRVGIKF